MGSKYDFSGWATRNDIKCADGLTIRQDAFADCDGITVPLVYMHDHKDPENVLGHAISILIMILKTDSLPQVLVEETKQKTA